ncbi:hypothetical protein E2C01_003509 [Portunus trituberculatus]|uniref:Uncharacterized protein n=1 Tax=Portunus trituberculatus TaxID=210409 RepID=A0A5B7CNV5_PORTR|nr:hypothetical protein [Portunus trituberculatus]
MKILDVKMCDHKPPWLEPILRPGFRPSEEHQDHIQAEQYGRSYGSCWSAYPDCPISMREQLYAFFMNNANIAENNSS